MIAPRTPTGTRVGTAECPSCLAVAGLVAVLPATAKRPVVFTLCGCTMEQVAQLDERVKRAIEPDKSVVVAARVIANGGTVRLEGHPDTYKTVRDFLAALGDPTQVVLWTRVRMSQPTLQTDESATAAAAGEPDETKKAQQEAEAGGAPATDQQGEDGLPEFDPSAFEPESESERVKYKAALEYIERGYPIVLLYGVDGDRCSCARGAACASPGKHPIGRDWTRRAIRSKETLAKRWRDKGGRSTNLGLALKDKLRLLLVDVDTKKGKGGDESIREWEQALGVRFEDYLVQNTPSGGGHYLFRVPDSFKIERLPNRTGVASGVDVLRDGRQFVLSPSTTPKGRYHRAGSDSAVVLPPLNEVPGAPKALLEHLASSASKSGSKANQKPLSDADLECLRAPNVEMVREAVRHIPNDEKFDAREKWVGMAYRIRTACGRGNEAEAREIFLEFSERWTGGILTQPRPNASSTH